MASVAGATSPAVRTGRFFRSGHARPVGSDGIAQPVLDIALVAGRAHVDEVDDDETAQIAQPELAGNFTSGFEIRGQRRCLYIAAFRRPCRVDVDGNERLGMIDDDTAARWQVNGMRKGGFDLTLDLIAGEQGRRHPSTASVYALVMGHSVRHELARFAQKFVWLSIRISPMSAFR